MLRGQNWKRESGQRLRGCHGLLRGHDLSDHGVIALNRDGLALCGYAVQYFAGISGPDGHPNSPIYGHVKLPHLS